MTVLLNLCIYDKLNLSNPFTLEHNMCVCITRDSNRALCGTCAHERPVSRNELRSEAAAAAFPIAQQLWLLTYNYMYLTYTCIMYLLTIFMFMFRYYALITMFGLANKTKNGF